MLEKRNSGRIPIGVHLHICDLYKQDAFGIHHLEVPIELTNISEQDIGFISECILPMHYQFHACLNLGTNPGFLTKLKIIRCKALEHDRYAYKCEFVELEDSFQTSIHQYIHSGSK